MSPLAEIYAWIDGHQTLIVGAIALPIAFMQMRISNRQSKIALRQQEQAERQRLTERAVAMLSSDNLIEQSYALTGLLHTHVAVSSRPLTPDPNSASTPSADPRVLEFIAKRADERGMRPADVEAIKADVVRAYPEDVTTIVQLAEAFNELLAMAAEYAKEPWQNFMMAGMFNASPDALRKLDDTVELFSRMMRLTAEAGQVQQRASAKKAAQA